MTSYPSRKCPVCQQLPSEKKLPYPTTLDGKASLSFEYIICCRKCGFAWAEPVATQSQLDNFYSKGDYWNKLIPESSIQRVHESCQAKNRVSTCKEFIGRESNVKVLDIGAGHGFISRWCDALSNNLVEKYDFIEPDLDKKNEILKRKTCFSVNGLNNLDSCNEKYDLIFLNHVLEHVADPIVFLRQVATRLNKGGLLYIEVPNKDHLYKEDVFPHTLFFNYNSLSQIATQIDLEIVSTQSFGVNNRGIMNRLLSQLFKASVYCKLEELQIYFDKKLWGYHKSSIDSIWLNIILRA